MIITENLYWGMVTVGLGLLAVCLPTLRSPFNGLPASTTDSLKGFFTLQTFKSHQSIRIRDQSTDRNHGLHQDPSRSLQSRIFVAGKEELGHVEAYPMH